MSGRPLDLRTLTPACGAEVRGVDLSRPLDEGTVAALTAALAEHGVLFFRGQALTPESHKALGRRFGELHLHPAWPRLVEGHPEIMEIYSDENTTRIVQLAPRESDALLAMLFGHVESPLFQCRFRWEPGSVAFWDNRCVQHQAVWDYYPHRRRARRVTVRGDRPYHRARAAS